MAKGHSLFVMNTKHLLVELPETACIEDLGRLLETGAPGCSILLSSQDCSQAALCRWLQALPADRLGEVQGVLSEAVEVLEKSRHAFKSLPLALLRRRLQALLDELSEHAESSKNPSQ